MWSRKDRIYTAVVKTDYNYNIIAVYRCCCLHTACVETITILTAGVGVTVNPNGTTFPNPGIHLCIDNYCYVITNALTTTNMQSVFCNHCSLHTAALPHCRTATLPHCRTATLPHCMCTAALPHCHTATLHVHCHTATLPHCHTATLPHCRTATLPHCHTACALTSSCSDWPQLLSYVSLRLSQRIAASAPQASSCTYTHTQQRETIHRYVWKVLGTVHSFRACIIIILAYQAAM